jgi:hypothetical protein
MTQTLYAHMSKIKFKKFKEKNIIYIVRKWELTHSLERQAFF